MIDAFFEALDQEQLRQNTVNSDQLYLETQKTQQAITTRWETLVKMLEKLNTDKVIDNNIEVLKIFDKILLQRDPRPMCLISFRN